jgi:hypothetical protein
MREESHRCSCPDCGASHVRLKPAPARCCLQCFQWISNGSRAKYCSAECRRNARLGVPAQMESAAVMAAALPSQESSAAGPVPISRR